MSQLLHTAASGKGAFSDGQTLKHTGYLWEMVLSKRVLFLDSKCIGREVETGENEG